MLNCKEQKNPVDFYGRKIPVSEQALNAMYAFCTTPVTEGTIAMYVSVKYISTDKAGLGAKKIAESLTDEEIAKITEERIKDEVVDTAGEEFWNKFA